MKMRWMSHSIPLGRGKSDIGRLCGGSKSAYVNSRLEHRPLGRRQGTKIRAVERDDLEAAASYLGALISLLPDARVVVTFGDEPRQGWFRYLPYDDAPLLPTLAVPHPSPCPATFTRRTGT